jgi:hypothetical protein
MDQLASMLLEFPPAGGFADDEQYNRAAKLHSQNLSKPAVSQHLRDAAALLIEVRASPPREPHPSNTPADPSSPPAC